MQAVAVVDAAKIRAHLRQSAEEVYRQELANAEKELSWEVRERLRQAAETSHTNRLARIDDLVTTFAEIVGTGRATSVFTEMQRILQEQGVDEAIAYAASKRGDILEQVRRRTATARERNRADMQPLLQTAALLDTKGKDAEARTQYDEILAADGDWPEALHRYFWFLVDQGDTARVRGSLVDAERDYSHAHSLAQQLTSRDPANTEWQRDVSISHNKIGDVLAAQGDGPGALAAYRNGLEIAEVLVARDTANTEWQRDLSVSHNRIGDMLVADGDGPRALAAYRKGLEIREALAAHDPANAEWQRDLSVSHNNIGDMRVAQGDGVWALAAYRKGLEIREALAAHDPANTEWRVDLAVSYAKLSTLENELSADDRRDYLKEGRRILVALKSEGKLMPNQDWVEWFDARLSELPPDLP